MSNYMSNFLRLQLNTTEVHCVCKHGVLSLIYKMSLSSIQGVQCTSVFILLCFVIKIQHQKQRPMQIYCSPTLFYVNMTTWNLNISKKKDFFSIYENQENFFSFLKSQRLNDELNFRRRLLSSEMRCNVLVLLDLMFLVDWFQQKAILVKFSPQATPVNKLFIYLFIYLISVSCRPCLILSKHDIGVYGMITLHNSLWCIL